MPIPVLSIVSLTTLLFLLSFASAQSPCGTDQNPYCAGNAEFEQLCCSWPNVCYWANRDGTPACCPAGLVCDGVAPYTTRTTYINPTTTVRPTSTTTAPPTTRTTVIAPSTITSYVSGGGVVVVTSTDAPVTIISTIGCGEGICSTITSGAAGVYSTVTSGVIGVYSTVTSEIGQVYSTVSGVLVGNDAPPTTSVAILIPLMTALFTVAWNSFG